MTDDGVIQLEPGSFVTEMLVDNRRMVGTVTVSQDMIDVTTEAEQIRWAWRVHNLIPGLKSLSIEVNEDLPLGPVKVRLLTDPKWLVPGMTVDREASREVDGSVTYVSRIVSTGEPQLDAGGAP
ncbi:MAG: hypothetical protein ACRDTZ_00395 [Pseudonocardiaceae bacterium]